MSDITAMVTAALVDLLAELRPDLPTAIAESFVVEALDAAAGATLDAAWALTRARLYPAAVATAQAARRDATGYAARRAAEAHAAAPRPDDYPGGPVAWGPLVWNLDESEAA